MFENCYCNNSNSSTYGGAANVSGTTSSIINTVIRNCSGTSTNSSGGLGGGLFINLGSKAENCLIYNNYSSFRGGGVFVHNSSDSQANLVRLYNLTVVNNVATNAGGGVFSNRLNVDAYNCVTWGNTNGTNPNNYNMNLASFTDALAYNGAEGSGVWLTKNAQTSPTNIVLVATNDPVTGTDLAPMFTNPTTFAGNTTDVVKIAEIIAATWTLKPGSALINNGINAPDNTANNSVAIAFSTTDIIGTTRPLGIKCDIGAYENSIPESPTNVIATPGNSNASVSFTVPTDDGGSVILDYTVTSNPGSITATAPSSPIKATGLTNGTAYTFTVKARNATGSSTASTASASVTPNATAYIIPVSSATNISVLTLTPVSDVVVSGNKLTINAAKTVNSITVAPGAQLELTSGNTLTAGTVILQSDATGTATLVDNTTNAPQAVTATVQQYVTEGRNWYMSIPLATGASSLMNKGTSVVCYEEPSGTWIAPIDGTLNKLRGYLQVATSTPSVTGTTGTVNFTGVLNTGAHSISLTRTVGKTGFNLVGNPYPSYLDWNLVTRTNVLPTMWYRTKEGGVYKFYTFVANGSAGVGSPAGITNKIPPMQAFWVRVDAEGSGSIAVDNTMRFHKDVTGNILKAPKQNTQQLLRLQVSNGVNTDETVLYFNANALDAFDQYDAQKRCNAEPSIPEIFTQVGSEQLVINGMNQVKYNTEIPIGFSTEQANNFSITANEISNFETGIRVILIDKQNPTVETELTNGTAYNFNSAITAPTTNRFSLLFRAPGVATDVGNVAKLNAQVFVNSASQITIIAPEKATYSIYNAVGQKIENGYVNSKLETQNSQLNSGVYLVELSVDGQSEVQKVIIR